MMKTLTSYLIVLPAVALTLACGEPAGAEQTVQGGLAPKGKMTKPTPKQIVAPDMIQVDVKKIVAPDMVQDGTKIVAPDMVQDGTKIVAPDMVQDGTKIVAPDMVQKPTTNALIGEDGMQLK